MEELKNLVKEWREIYDEAMVMDDRWDADPSDHQLESERDMMWAASDDAACGIAVALEKWINEQEKA